MNKQTHFFIKIYLSYFILKRVDVGWVWEMSWRWGQTAILTQVLLATIAALLPHLGWGCTEGPKPSVCRWLSLRHLVPSWLQLGRTASGTWLYYCLMPTCFRCSSAYLHRCISWLTARLRVNMLQLYLVMINRIGTVYPWGSNKGFSLRFCVDSWVQHKTPEEGRRTYQPKRCEYNNKDDINSPNILSNNNYQASSQKFG